MRFLKLIYILTLKIKLTYYPPSLLSISPHASIKNALKSAFHKLAYGPLAFLRQREVIHFQRFGELLNHYNELKEKGLL